MHETSINSHLHVNVYFRQLIYIRQLNQVTDMHLVSGGFGVKWLSSTAGPPLGGCRPFTLLVQDSHLAGEGPSLAKCRPITWRVKALHLVRGKQLAAFLRLGVEELSKVMTI